MVDSLARRYGDAFALGPLTATFEPGVTCLVGPNGAGKSTFFRLVAEVDRPTSGTVALAGTPHRRVGYLPQEIALPENATARQFLHYVAWVQRVPAAERQDAVSRALADVGLTDRADDRVRRLSGGMRRRLGIAHALVHDPALVLLDEPTAGLDPRQRIALRETVAALGGERIVLVATHLVEDVRGLADRVVVLHEGQVVHDGDVPSLERQAEPDAPGDTALERAVAGLIGAASDAREPV